MDVKEKEMWMELQHNLYTQQERQRRLAIIREKMRVLHEQEKFLQREITEARRIKYGSKRYWSILKEKLGIKIEKKG